MARHGNRVVGAVVLTTVVAGLLVLSAGGPAGAAVESADGDAAPFTSKLVRTDLLWFDGTGSDLDSPADITRPAALDSGGYGYRFLYRIQENANPLMPIIITDRIVNDFNRFFPFKSECARLILGAVCNLRFFTAVNPVQVTLVGPSGWVLLSLPGHAEGPGKLIWFVFKMSNGDLMLEVTARGPANTWCNTNRECTILNTMFAHDMWEKLAEATRWWIWENCWRPGYCDWINA